MTDLGMVSYDKSLEAMMRRVRKFNVAKGWRVDGDHLVPDANGRTFGDDIALIHSELSEALEAYRDHGLEPYIAIGEGEQIQLVDPGEYGPCKPEGVPSELADVFIRLLDTCAHLGVDLEREFRMKMDYNDIRSNRHGGKNL